MARQKRKPRVLAKRDAKGRPRAFGSFISEEAYRELKAREKDKSFQAKIAKAEQAKERQKQSNKRQVAASKRAQKYRKKRLAKAKALIPSLEKREEELAKGRLKGQLRGSTSVYTTTVYIFEGVESFPIVRDFIREILLREKPQPMVRVTVRAGNGRYAESIGTLWNTPRGTLRALGALEHSQSAKQLFALAEDKGWTIYIEVEVKRPRKEMKGNNGRAKEGKGNQRKRNQRPKRLDTRVRRVQRKRGGKRKR